MRTNVHLHLKEVLSMGSIYKTTLAAAVAFVTVSGLVACAGAWQNAPAATATRTAIVKLDAQRTLGRPEVFKNLTIIPVYDKTARPSDSYLTLDEGLKLKLVSVKESKNGGDVNTLYVTNESKKSLYLMGGEVVLGGQQDRTLGRDTIIPPGKKVVPVTVFCVEHGRWTGRSDFDQSAPTVASAEIRSRAQNGEFFAARAASGTPAAPAQIAREARPAANSAADVQTGRAEVLNQSAAASRPYRNGRASGRIRSQASAPNNVGDAQQQVWDKVAEKNSKLKTESSTGTYRRALTLSAGDAQKSVPAYLTALSSSLGTDPHLVGVVAAINGKVVAADIFGDPALFRKLWPKLLRSYASDAVEHTPDSGTKAVAVTAIQAKEFLIAATDAKSKIENKSDVGSTVRFESSQAVTYSLVPNAKASAPMAGGFGGGAVHMGVLGK